MVIVQFGKVKCFKEKIHLQNCMNCTKIIYNPDCQEAVSLRNRMSEIMESPTQGLTQLVENGTVGMADDFLGITPRNTIEGLKYCKQDEEWWYTACICNKSVYPDHKMYFCEKCNKHVMKVVPRYCIKVRVIDQTDCATFVIFDRDAILLFNNKSCSEIFESHEKNSAQGSFPKEILDLVDRTFLFKVEYKDVVSSKFEQSFRVKKLCNDTTIMNKFISLVTKSVSDNGSSQVGKESMLDGSNIELVQDLMPKFSYAVVDNESQFEEGCDLSKDSGVNSS